MRDGFAGPVHGNQIDRVELGEIIGPGLPARCEVGFRSVIEISHAVDRNQVADDFAIRSYRRFRLPVPVVGRLDLKEQQNKQRKYNEKACQSSPVIMQKQKREKRSHNERRHEHGSHCFTRQR
jgi:hypothetical protein